MSGGPGTNPSNRNQQAYRDIASELEDFGPRCDSAMTVDHNSQRSTARRLEFFAGIDRTQLNDARARGLSPTMPAKTPRGQKSNPSPCLPIPIRPTRRKGLPEAWFVADPTAQRNPSTQSTIPFPLKKPTLRPSPGKTNNVPASPVNRNESSKPAAFRFAAPTKASQQRATDQACPPKTLRPAKSIAAIAYAPQTRKADISDGSHLFRTKFGRKGATSPVHQGMQHVKSTNFVAASRPLKASTQDSNDAAAPSGRPTIRSRSMDSRRGNGKHPHAADVNNKWRFEDDNVFITATTEVPEHETRYTVQPRNECRDITAARFDPSVRGHEADSAEGAVQEPTIEPFGRRASPSVDGMEHGVSASAVAANAPSPAPDGRTAPEQPINDAECTSSPFDAGTPAEKGQSTQPNAMPTLRGNAPIFAPSPQASLSGISPTKMDVGNAADNFDIGAMADEYIPREKWLSLPQHQRLAIQSHRRARSSSSASGSSRFTCQSLVDPQGNILSPKPAWHWSNRRTTIPSPVKSRSLEHSPTRSSDSPTSVGHEELGWAIGSAMPGWKYGWRGGDGREIAFNGYGPDAEKDARPFFNFRARAAWEAAMTSPTPVRMPDWPCQAV